ncbi:MAG: FRG domain-containing protein, partial [Anaerolineales bacterium]|nr:FRG domain-containing protein [Anaerolineales bacterium]
MHTYKVRNLVDYLDLLGKLCKTDDFLFRGLSRDFPLLPKLARLKYEVPIIEAEAGMLRELRRRSQPYLEFRPESDWDWLALAQHHGMATRLLDWSKNSLAALWFAVTQAASGQDGIVWILNTDGLEHVDSSSNVDPFDNTQIRVFRPRYITRRIGAQEGWFTCHPYDARTDIFTPYLFSVQQGKVAMSRTAGVERGSRGLARNA